MAKKEFSMAFLIGAQLKGSFGNTFSNVLKTFSETNAATEKNKKVLNSLTDAYKNGTIAAQTFQRNLALQSLGVFSARMAKTKASMEVFNRSFGAMTTIAAPFVSATKTAATFEAAMSKVGAICRADDNDLAALTKKARELGETTQFTATQSAEAMSYLGMAGWDTKKIIAGMPGLLSLAAAGGTDLARTADIVSDNLTAFGLDAEQSTHMADVYATVITNTNTNVEMLGDTMKYAAPVAHAFGASMEETAALAGLMANSGIKASQAGTSLRAGFLRLAGPPKMASKAMEELGMSMNDITAEQKESAMALESLGIKLSDTNGPRKMSAILTELREKTAKLGQEEKLAAMKSIFGQEAATGWLAVLNSGDKTFDELVTKLEKSGGAADEIAKKMQNNAQGAMTRFNSAVESAQISIGQAFLPAMAAAAEAGATFFGWFAGSETLTNVAIGIGVVGVALTGFVAAVSAGAAVVNAYKTASIACNAVSKAFKACTILSTAAQWAMNAAMYACPIGLFIAGVTAIIAVGYALYTNWDTIKQWFITLWDNPALAIQQFVNGIKDKFSDAFSWVQEKWQAISDFISKPIFGKVNITAQGSSGSDVAHNASGGIYGKGAFLTTFAESSGESAIPHTPNARNIGLLAETNRIMGNPLGGGGNVTATFAPNITIQGGGDEGKIRKVLELEMAKFKKMLQDLQNQQRRVSYA
jgi:TP901 family phage tail tape measure protein